MKLGGERAGVNPQDLSRFPGSQEKGRDPRGIAANMLKLCQLQCFTSAQTFRFTA